MVRKGILFVGLAVLVVGIALFAAAAVQVQQAATAFMNCLANFPSGPIGGFPSSCVDAMNAAATWQLVEGLGGILGLVGFILLLLAFILEPERPAVAYGPYYPPPVYAAPPAYAPSQGPQTPPPQP